MYYGFMKLLNSTTRNLEYSNIIRDYSKLI